MPADVEEFPKTSDMEMIQCFLVSSVHSLLPIQQGGEDRLLLYKLGVWWLG